MRAEVVDPTRAALGEGPLWDSRRRLLHWIDIDGSCWHRWSDSEGALPVVPLAQTPGFLALHEDGGLVAGVERGFARLADGGTLSMIAEVETRADHRMNDGEADSLGRVWGSTVARSCDAPTGALWRLDRDGSAHVVVAGTTIGNGIAFADGGLWFVDSATHSVDWLDLDVSSGRVSGRRSVIRFEEHEEPDGLCLDAEGGIWVAVWNGWSVRRFDDAGRETARVDVEAAHVTSCAFGGPDLDQLFITTAARGAAGQRHAGSLFRALPGVRGRAPYVSAVNGGAPRSSSAGM